MIGIGRRWTDRAKSSGAIMSDENERIRAVILGDILCTPTSTESLPENSLHTVDHPSLEILGILTGDDQA